jgi:hypothetical protein
MRSRMEDTGAAISVIVTKYATEPRNLYVHRVSGSPQRLGLCRCRAYRVRRLAYMTRNTEHTQWTVDYLGSDFTIRNVELAHSQCRASTLRSFDG